MDEKIQSVAFAERDATEFVKAWNELGAKQADCTILLSGKATKTSILSHLKRFLNNVEDSDTVIFFYAGHGLKVNDANYITAHDTMDGDRSETSISLSRILDMLKSSKSKRTMLFIDACHSGLPISDGMRSFTSVLFSAEGLTEFCKDSKFCIAFAACQSDEFSWPSPTLQHGIWTYCVIRALTGKEKSACARGSLITGDSLRDYLSTEVPKLLRETKSDNATQTPCIFGNATKQFVVADLTALPAVQNTKSVSSLGLGSLIKDIRLRGVEEGYVEALSGFDKGRYHIPRGHSTATEMFVCSVGSEDVKKRGGDILCKICDAFSYKRADWKWNYQDGNSVASIKTPDFDVNIRIKQDDQYSNGYILTTEVTNIRQWAVVEGDKFQNLFSEYCDTVVIAFPQSFDIKAPSGIKKTIDIKEIIEKLEEPENTELNLDYPPDDQWLKLSFEKLSIELKITNEEITFTLLHGHDLKQLLTNAKASLRKISSYGIRLPLGNKDKA
jgi:hypothetical protein